MRNAIKVIQVTVLMCFLVTPVAVLFILPDQIFSLNENRVLKELPVGWDVVLSKDGRYGKELSEYFNDRFQFRDFLIRIKGEMEYRIFQMTGENGVYVGSDGYLYYKNVIDKEQIANERLSKEAVRNIVTSFENLKEYINSYGKECLFMLPPQKNEVFPERIPEFHVMRNNPNMYQTLMKMLSESNVAEDFVNVIPILRTAEKKYPTYYKTDFHWNSYGAAAAFTEIVNILAVREGMQNDVFGDQMYDIYYEPEFAGGQLDNFPLLEKWTEEAVFTRKKGECTNKIDEEHSNDIQMHYLNTNKNAPLGKVLLIGDSYTTYMLYSGCGILDVFQEVWFVHVGASQKAISKYLDQVDYVIVERIESAMPFVSLEIDEMTDLNLK